MKKIFFLTLILTISGSLSTFAQNESIAREMFDAIFNITVDGEQMLDAATIKSKLQTAGFKESAPQASSMDYATGNDSQFKVKSTLTTYSKEGNDVGINIPTGNRYKDQYDVTCTFPNLSSRDAFLRIASENGFSSDEDAVEGLNYMGNYIAIWTFKSNDLTLHFSYY